MSQCLFSIWRTGFHFYVGIEWEMSMGWSWAWIYIGVENGLSNGVAFNVAVTEILFGQVNSDCRGVGGGHIVTDRHDRICLACSRYIGSGLI